MEQKQIYSEKEKIYFQEIEQQSRTNSKLIEISRQREENLQKEIYDLN